MLPEKRIPSHPGEILLLEFLSPLRITQVRFARHLGVPLQRINEIIKGKRGVTAETAVLFARALGTSPEFWMNLQSAHDLARASTRTPPARVQPIATARAAREQRRSASERAASPRPRVPTAR